MKVIKFKTSLKCGGCVNAISPHLKKINNIQSWEVDLADPNKVLIVSTETNSISELQMEIQDAFKTAGYKAELT